MVEVNLQANARVAYNAVVHVQMEPRAFSFGPITLQVGGPSDWVVIELHIGVNSQLAYDKREVRVPASGVIETDYHDICKAGQVLGLVVRYVGADPEGGLFSAVARGPRC
jgi:hypothetical protein